MRLKANAAYVTDTGRVRSQNQDAARIAQNKATEWPVFVVADGMGGHAAGEVAAELAVEALIEVTTDPDGLPDPEERVRLAIGVAQRRIQVAAAAAEERARMGTTCLVALLAGQRLYLGHVGDSRAYVCSGGCLEQVTSDHSWVNEQVRAGLLAPADAARHPMRHVITRALGQGAAEPDLIQRDLQPGDWLLLCTDGLTGSVEDTRIAELLARSDHPEVAARELVDMANQAGGPDNITVLLVRLETVDPLPPPAAESPRRTPNHRHRLLVGVAIALIAVVLAAGLIFLRPAREDPAPNPLAPPGPPPTQPAR